MGETLGPPDKVTTDPDPEDLIGDRVVLMKGIDPSSPTSNFLSGELIDVEKERGDGSKILILEVDGGTREKRILRISLRRPISVTSLESRER